VTPRRPPSSETAAAAVTGLIAEARLVRRAGLRAVSGGGNSARTAALVRELVETGVKGLVSFGIAGGLDPTLQPGMLVLPLGVRGEGGERWPVDAAWRARLDAGLSRAGLAVAAGDVLGAAEAADSVARKATLFAGNGAIAVDLESHLVARAAAGAGLPFVVLRAVADPALRALPPAALVGLDADGRPAIGRVIAALARRPGQLPALLQVARDTRRAMLALRRGCEVLADGALSGDHLAGVP
jgi:adenosylhomocysteine nucleosidase